MHRGAAAAAEVVFFAKNGGGLQGHEGSVSLLQHSRDEQLLTNGCPFCQTRKEQFLSSSTVVLLLPTSQTHTASEPFSLFLSFFARSLILSLEVHKNTMVDSALYTGYSQTFDDLP